MNIKILSVAALAITLQASAMAADWWPVGFSEVDIQFVDRSSIIHRGKNLVSFWVMFVNKPKPNDEPDTGKELIIVDCKHRMMVTKTYITYWPDGTTNTSNTLSNDDVTRKMGDVVPDSVGEAEFEAVCTWKQLEWIKNSRPVVDPDTPVAAAIRMFNVSKHD